MRFRVWKASLLAISLLVAGGLMVTGIHLRQPGSDGVEQQGGVALPPVDDGGEEVGEVAASAEPPGPLGPAATEAPLPTREPLPATEPKKRTIVLDPGHGGWEVGAVHRSGRVVEKNVNLDIALRVRDLLEQADHRVVMTRDSDRGVLEPPSDASGYPRTRADLQKRIDIANEANADLFLSIHNNGSSSPSESGTEVWYCKDRPFAEQNLALAGFIKDNLLSHLQAVGYTSRDRGLKEDANFRWHNGRPFHLAVLGPPRDEPYAKGATNMPGALAETLFVSNDTEAALLQDDNVLNALAQGFFDGVQAYFQWDRERVSGQ